MADNYLEKKMADYRSGVSGRRSTLRPGVSRLRYEPLTVVVATTDHAMTQAVARLFVDAGCKVICPCEAGCVAGSGARIYPADYDAESIAADMRQRAEQADAVISDAPSGYDCLAPRHIYVTDCQDVAVDAASVAIIGHDPSQAAWLALALARRGSTVANCRISL